MGDIAMGHHARRFSLALKDLFRAAQAEGVLAVMDYGTLLGAARDGGMIPWDSDADISVFVTDDWDSRFEKFMHRLRRVGFGVNHKGRSQRLGLSVFEDGFFVRKNRVLIDVFVWHPHIFEDGSKIWYRKRYAPTDRKHEKGLFVDDAWLKETTLLPFEGIPLPASVEWEVWLEHRYGDWRQPRDQKRSPSSSAVYRQHHPSAEADQAHLQAMGLAPQDQKEECELEEEECA
jgi:hypothetical protein